MKISKKVWLLIIIPVVLFVLYIALTNWLEGTLTEKLEKLEESDLSITYQDLDVDMIKRQIRMDAVKISKKNHFEVFADHISLSGIHVMELINKEKIIASDLLINHPKIITFKKDSIDKRLRERSDTPKEFTFAVDKLTVKNGTATLQKERTDDRYALRISDFSIQASELVISDETIAGDIPVRVKDHYAELSNITSYPDSLNKLTVARVVSTPEEISAFNYSLDPLDSLDTFIRKLSNEKDYIKLFGEKLTIRRPLIKKVDDKKMYTADGIYLDSLALDIYRDKRLPDDLTEKPMYSALLRAIPFGIDIDSLSITKGFIKYKEQPDNDADPGLLEFHKLNLATQRISNLPDADTIKVIVTAKYMDQAPIKLDWRFDVNDSTDVFTIRGSILDVRDTSMNAFIAPTLNIEGEGKLDALYYNYRGNNYKARGATMVNFEGFNLKPVKGKAKLVTSILTKVANLFLNAVDENEIESERGIEVLRDQSKSFWNYFWLCVKKSLVEAIK